MSNQASSAKSDEPLSKLIEIAARLTDLEAGGSRNNSQWLRNFRNNYRHMAVTFGVPFGHPSIWEAETRTDKALEEKSEAQAA